MLRENCTHLADSTQLLAYAINNSTLVHESEEFMQIHALSIALLRAKPIARIWHDRPPCVWAKSNIKQPLKHAWEQAMGGLQLRVAVAVRFERYHERLQFAKPFFIPKSLSFIELPVHHSRDKWIELRFHCGAWRVDNAKGFVHLDSIAGAGTNGSNRTNRNNETIPPCQHAGTIAIILPASKGGTRNLFGCFLLPCI